VWSLEEGLNIKPAVPWIRPVRIQVERGRKYDYIVEIKIPLGIKEYGSKTGTKLKIRSGIIFIKILLSRIL